MQTDDFQWQQVKVSVDYGGVVNYAFQQNGQPVVLMLRLEHGGDEPIEDLSIHLSSDAQECEGSTVRIGRLKPESTWTKRRIGLDFPPAELAALDERKSGELSLRLDGKDVESKEFRLPVDWLAYNEWPGVGFLPQMLAAFVLPNHPELVEMRSRMRDIMERWTDSGSLSGYQSGDRDYIRQVAAASFGALQELGFSYVEVPASFERDGQKVRTAEQMFNSRMGTCLDVTLLVAAALESVGLHPIVVIIEGHAFVGVWLKEETFPEAIVDDAAQLRKRAKLGQALFFDPTVAVSSNSATFDSAEEQAMASIGDFSRFVLAVDVRAARLTGIRPISSRVIDDDNTIRVIDHSEREDRVEAQAPKRRSNGGDIEQRARQHLDRLSTTDEDRSGRLERWRSKLLDLTLRNRLLNFRHTQSTAMLMHHNVGSLEDALATGKTFKLHSKPDLVGAFSPMADDATEVYEEEDKLRQFIDDGLQSKRIHSAYPPAEHAKRMKKIYRKARREMQETGVNLLHVAVGYLRWFEPDKPNTPRLAPLILLPAKLERISATDNYKLSLTDDEALINFSLLEKLRQEFDLEVPGLSVLPEDASGLDIDLIFKQFREAILDARGWDIIEIAFLGIMSFGKFMMWHDLRENEERLIQNPIASRLLDPTESTGDKAQPPEAQPAAYSGGDFCVMEADSSQLEAVQAASNGQSFVLQGPPGTGKSQTITNIIAQCLGEGKNVLFVAEKQAALEVVYRRLREVGLDDFSLRLHSDSANKRGVASQLGEALRMAGEHSATKWETLVEQLEASRRPINAYVKVLHRKRTLGISLFRAVARLTELQDVPRVKTELDIDPGELGEKRFEDMTESVSQLADFSRQVAPVDEHPLKAIRTELLDPDARRDVRQQIESLHRAADDVEQILSELPGDLPEPDDAGLDSLQSHARIVDKLRHRPPGGRCLSEVSNWQLVEPRLEESIEVGQRLKKTREELADHYTEKLYELELEEARRKIGRWSEAFFLIAFIMLWGMRRRLQKVTTDGNLPDNQTIGDHLDQAIEVEELEEQLADQKMPRELEGTLWRGDSTDWETLHGAWQWTAAYRRSLQHFADRNRWSQLARQEFLPVEGQEATIDAYRQAVEELACAYRELMSVVEIDEDIAWSTDAQNTWVQAVISGTDRWLESFDELRRWSLYLQARQTVVGEGLEPVVQALESGRCQPHRLDGVAQKAVLWWWVERIFASEEQLRSFSGVSHRHAIEKFRELDRRSFQMARREILARLSSRIPEPQATSTNSEIGVLLREIQKKSRHMPIRTLFSKIPKLLPRIAPCMLMSPMSVAQYLSEDPVDFDLVVFDEASQIPPWDALGAISRADQCVVVGDSKQLPPTNFFSKSYENEEIHEIEDLESILDECVATGMNTRRLRWHYRSRDESLIAFSNFHYYDNELFTFPSAVDELDSLGVSYRYIDDGFYDKGRSRTNEAEARAVVAEIVRRLTDPEDSRRSIGVVTFSKAQQTLIEDLLDEARRDHPVIEPYFSAGVAESVFVKNLENVQGDERDIMMFSICYGPDENGHLSMNFGPLNRQGGERRLNVAITRAREQLIVFSKLQPRQIDLTRTSATAVEHLKTFLKYAQHGPQAMAEATTRSSGNAAYTAIQNRVENHLTDQGYEVCANVGCSGYQIDVAVRHPDHPDTFLLGIELDGESYRLGSTARDRERTRRVVLQSLGWRLHRIWTADWWHDSQRQLSRLSDRLAELDDEAPPSLVTTTNVEVASVDDGSQDDPEDEGFDEVDDQQQSWVDNLLGGGEVDYLQLDGATAWKDAELAEDQHTQREFNSDANLEAIAESAAELIDVEQPVSTDRLTRRVAGHWGYSRASKRIATRIIDALETLPKQRRPRRQGDFWWSPTTDPKNYRAFRPSQNDQRLRDLDEIAPREAANAAYAILECNISLPPQELYRETVRAFGFSQLGSNLRVFAEEAVQLLIDDGRVDVDADMISIVEENPENAETAPVC